jgi:hypothetical protein
MNGQEGSIGQINRLWFFTGTFSQPGQCATLFARHAEVLTITTFMWFWNGFHREYETLIKKLRSA